MRFNVFSLVLVCSLMTGCASGIVEDRHLWDGVPAETKSIAMMIGVLPQALHFELPRNLSLAYIQQNKLQYLAEYIPENETLESWTRMITVQGISHRFNMSPYSWMLSNMSAYHNACQNSYIEEKLGTTKVGPYKAFHVIVGCKDWGSHDQWSSVQGAEPKKGMSEIAYLLFFKGDVDAYMVKKSIRTTDKKFSLTKKNYKAFIKNMMPIALV